LLISSDELFVGDHSPCVCPYVCFVQFAVFLSVILILEISCSE